MTDLYFIVAKNLAEFRRCREDKLKDPVFGSKYTRQTIVMVTDPVHTKGYQIEHGCFYGNWRENPLMFNILQNMAISAKTKETDKIIREVYKNWRKEQDGNMEIN